MDESRGERDDFDELMDVMQRLPRERYPYEHLFSPLYFWPAAADGTPLNSIGDFTQRMEQLFEAQLGGEAAEVAGLPADAGLQRWNKLFSEAREAWLALHCDGAPIWFLGMGVLHLCRLEIAPSSYIQRAELLARHEAVWRERVSTLQQALDILTQDQPIAKWIEDLKAHADERQALMEDWREAIKGLRQVILWLRRAVNRDAPLPEAFIPTDFPRFPVYKGRPEEAEINRILTMWVEALKWRNINPHWCELAAILNAADLPNCGTHYFDEEKLRKRVERFVAHHPEEIKEIRRHLRDNDPRPGDPWTTVSLP